MKFTLNKIILLSTFLLVICALSLLLGHSVWRPWVATMLNILLIFSWWTVGIGLSIYLSRSVYDASFRTQGNGFAHFMATGLIWIMAICGLLFGSLYVGASWLFTLPSTFVAQDGTKIYEQCQWLESKNCEYTKANSWFTKTPYDYQVPPLADSTPQESPSPSDVPDSSALEPSTFAESPQPSVPSEISEDSIVATSSSIPNPAGAEEFGVIMNGNSYMSVSKIEGTWIPGGEISPIGMHRDIYNIFALDDSVWFVGFGTPHGGETYYSTDAGHSWSAFSPSDFEEGENAPSFLESARGNADGYFVTMNYPSWVTNAGDGIIYYSADGVVWEKK